MQGLYGVWRGLYGGVLRGCMKAAVQRGSTEKLNWGLYEWAVWRGLYGAEVDLRGLYEGGFTKKLELKGL